MPISNPFLIHGRVYNQNTSSYVSNATVIITYENSPQETVQTDSDGIYIKIVQSQASNGEVINFSCTVGSKTVTDSYTLDITDLSHEVNLIIPLFAICKDLEIQWGVNPSEQVTCSCNGWKRTNDEIAISTVLGSKEKDDLLDNVKPGAVESLFDILGENYYVDTTWQNKNTLNIKPKEDCHLSEMYRETTIAIKSVALEPINRDKWGIIIIGLILSEVI